MIGKIIDSDQLSRRNEISDFTRRYRVSKFVKINGVNW